MSEIEWQETHEYQPQERRMSSFCRENGLACQPDSGSLTAFIEQSALEGLHEFLASDPSREQGGVLVGQAYFDPEEERYFTLVKVAIPALETEGTPVHLQFTPESWKYISGMIEEAHPDQVIVGWYHSHPGLSVFMSGTDRATQKAFFNHPWNLAVVVDPLQRQTGWFSGEDCLDMNRSQVIAFQPGKLAAQPATGWETEYQAGQRRKDWSWLLPVGMLALAFLLSLAWLWRQKLIT